MIAKYLIQIYELQLKYILAIYKNNLFSLLPVTELSFIFITIYILCLLLWDTSKTKHTNRKESE